MEILVHTEGQEKVPSSTGLVADVEDSKVSSLAQI
jgi:hypothetical protein